jgi:hypothetical protein
MFLLDALHQEKDVQMVWAQSCRRKLLGYLDLFDLWL